MGRFFCREALAGLAILFVVGGLVALFAPDLSTQMRILILVGVPILFHWPINMVALEHVLDFYDSHCMYDSAMRLALVLRDSSLDRKMRDHATLNLSFVQIATGDYAGAVNNLRHLVVTQNHPIMKSVVDGALGYCLAYMGKELDKAEALISGSVKLQPQEGIFVSFLALLRLRQHDFEGAKLLLEKSIDLDPTPDIPHWGERAYMMAQIQAGLGDMDKAREFLDMASQAHPRSRFSIMAKEALASGDLKSIIPEAVSPAAALAVTDAAPQSSQSSDGTAADGEKPAAA